MPRRRTLSALASVLLCLGSFAALAQTPAPRLHGPLREDARTTLPGSRPDLTLQGSDLGPVSPNEPLHGITLVFSRSPAQQAELDQLLAAQQDPASPQFHQWLTPERFGDRFGMAEADLDRTADWLRDEGFTITSTSRARDRIVVSGTAATVEHAFGPALHRFRNDAGNLHIAPTSDVTLPTGLASITAAVLHLSTVRPVALSRVTPRPAYTTTKTGAHYLTPADLATMYDLPVQLSGNNVTVGTGQTIAIVGQSYTDLSSSSAVINFLLAVNGRGSLVSSFLLPGSGNKAISPGDTLESEVDVEYAAGIAPYASVLLVYVGSDPSYNVFDSLAYSIDHNVAPVVSISYGVCEPLLSNAELNSFNSLFQQAATQGQTLIASSGDAGALACAPFSPSGQFTAVQQAALAVNFPASSPYVTAVGGTQMTDNSFAASNTTDWRTPSPSGTDLANSLTSWVPEVTWNESSVGNGLFASTGGASSVQPRPSWQTGVPGIPAGSTRLLPDVSFQASSMHPGFLFCTNVRAYGGGSCPYYNDYGSAYPLIGGTSLAAPTFAGIVAALNQDTQSLGQGSVNPLLYRLAASPAIFASAFHDITSGTTACPAGIPSCSTAGQTAFPAGVGYDLATGLGSLDYKSLRSAWPVSASSTFSTALSFQNYLNAPSPGSTESIQVNINTAYAPGYTAPTGNLALTLDGAPLPAVPLTPYTFGSFGQATVTITVPSAVGSHLLKAIYPGDSTHSGAYGVLSIPVGDSLATGTVTISSSAVTLPANGSVKSTISIVPGGGYSGRLSWTLALSASSGTSATSLCYLVTSPAIQGPASATLFLGSGTACSATTGHLTRPAILSRNRPPVLPWAGASAASALLIGLLPFCRRRRLSPLLAIAVTAILLPSISGCGGGSPSGGSSTPPPTPAASYTATLTAQDSVNSAITTATTFTLTVQ